jgi:hypothetical protein
LLLIVTVAIAVIAAAINVSALHSLTIVDVAVTSMPTRIFGLRLWNDNTMTTKIVARVAAVTMTGIVTVAITVAEALR